MTVQIKTGYNNVKTCTFGSAKWFWPSIFAQCVQLLKKAQRSLTPACEEE
jgi:hypothetical protein